LGKSQFAEMGRQKPNNSQLKPAEIERFRVALVFKRADILGDVSTMEAEALRRQRSDLSNLPLHLADVGSDNYEIENTLGLMDSERRLLMEINDALARIDKGTYGICESGDERIPKERLKAIPWARYCISCASMLERGPTGPRYSLEESGHDDGNHDDED
jgi:RNA polymerase-binding protein DksA